MAQAVYTAGYEGLSVQQFVRRLRDAQVGTVADVRIVPLSRIPGFSKNVLAAKLKRAGIQYVHVKSAGNPCRDVDDSLAAYRKHLRKDRSGVIDLQRVIREAVGPVCLLCFEAEAEQCHRGILVEQSREGSSPVTGPILGLIGKPHSALAS